MEAERQKMEQSGDYVQQIYEVKLPLEMGIQDRVKTKSSIVTNRKSRCQSFDHYSILEWRI
jgi:hypothetical protein